MLMHSGYIEIFQLPNYKYKYMPHPHSPVSISQQTFWLNSGVDVLECVCAYVCSQSTEEST